MDINKKRIKILALILVSVVALLLVSNKNHHSQIKKEEKQEESLPISVVRAFWRFSEKGDLEKAKLLRTNKAGKLVIYATNSPTWEQTIFNSGLKYLSAEIEEIKEKEVTVKALVETQEGNKLFYYHILLMEEKEWKIFAITF